MVNTPVVTRAMALDFTLACPVCREPLTVRDETATCAVCGEGYCCDEGIWRFLRGSGLARYQRFLEQYQLVRAREGWGSDRGEYYRQLPQVAPDDPQRAIWSLRAQHLRVFIQKVLRPLEQMRQRPLKILDLGAGNGWLANRLSERGHSVAAVDISVDAKDGLAALAHYRHHILPVQADFDSLPFMPGQADMALFNGAFHYTSDAAATLQEALRMIRPDGQVVLMDSPFYADPAAGAVMVRERRRDFACRYGIIPEGSSGDGYIVRRQLGQLGQALSCSFSLVYSQPVWRRRVRRAKAAMTMRSEPAGFPIIQVEPCPVWQASLVRRALRRLWEPYLRLRYRVIEQPRARQTYETRVAGRAVRVLPTVFDPGVFRSGEWFAEQLNSRMIPTGCRALDLGTGTGIGAIVAARWARQVVAVDINPQAVRCALDNIQRHHLQQYVEVRQGDLFAPLGKERFDVVLMNPPFLQGSSTGPLSQAFYSDGIAERFAAELRNHLTPGGYALVLLSSLGQTAEFLQALRWRCFRIVTLVEQAWVAERFTLYQVSA